jgi:hypothetical protein
VAAPPLDLLCDRPVTYPGDNKILEKSSKARTTEEEMEDQLHLED